MTDFKYPGYTPMTDSDLYKAYYDAGEWRDGRRAIEQAVLSRLTKPDADPVAWRVRTKDSDGRNITDYTETKPSEGMIAYIRQSAQQSEITPLYANPPQDTAEREALVALLNRVLVFNTGDSDPTAEWELLCNDIRAYLTGGGA